MNIIDNLLFKFIDLSDSLYIIPFTNSNFVDNECSKNHFNHKLSHIFALYRYNIKLLNSIKRFINNSEEDDLKLIDKLFEGKHDIKDDLNFFKTINFIKTFISSYKDNKLIDKCYLYLINKYNKRIEEFIFSYSLFKPSLILAPITLGNVVSIDTYIRNIYIYLSAKEDNNYKSSFIALFYYYIGLLLSLCSLYSNNNINVLQSNLIIILAKISSFIKIDGSGDCPFDISDVLSLKYMNIINNSLYISGLDVCSYCPYLIGLTKYVLVSSGILSKLSFRNITHTLRKLILEYKIDWQVEVKTNILLSDFIPIGSGWYRYFIN